MDQISMFEGQDKFKITQPIRLIELFAGIGSQAKALKNLGVDFEHYRICEFDKYAVASYNAVHETKFETSDITKITANDLGIVDTDKYCYIMTYSFPCQDLSNAGLGKGMAKGSGTRSGLLWEVERLLDECNELPNILLMENVPQVIGQNNIQHFAKWIEKLEQLGYKNKWQVLNAKDYGIPQNRERCFMVSILGDYYYDFPKTIPLTLRLKNMLEQSVEEKYYLSDSMLDYIVSKDDKYKVNENSLVINRDLACTINTRVGNTRADASDFICESLPDNYNLIKNKCNCIGTLKGGKWDKMHDINKRVYSPNACSPTITTCEGGHREPKIVEEIKCEEIQINTTVKVRKYEVDAEKLKLVLKESKQKLGWSIGSIAEYLKRSKTEVEHWFRTDNCFSIPSADVWFELKDLLDIQTDEFDKSITEFIDKPNKFESSNRAYSDNGLSPTITATTSPNVAEPIIYDDYNGRIKADQSVINTLTTNCGNDAERNGVKLLVPNATKQGYQVAECGDSINLSFPNSKTRRGRVGKGMSQTLDCQCNQGTLSEDLRIRKLTPKECWRLMGFEDADFEKAKAAGISDSQLYKQAGNSIVVNVLMAIFSQMI